MKKKNTTKSNSYLIIFIVLILIVVVYFVTRPSNPSQPVSNNYPTRTNIQNATQVYESKNLKFFIKPGSSFKIEDTGITVTLSDINGEINIIRNGTQFDNPRDYLKDADSKTSVRVEQENKIVINGLDAVNRIEYPTARPASKYKIYFIFANNSVYALSTSSPALFADLDQIAQSFRYTP